MAKLDGRKLSFQTLNKFVQQAKDFLKTDKTMMEVFKKYDVSIDELQYIPIYFGELDVSAKTSHGMIVLNFKLIENGSFFEDYSYIVHEVTHWLQQTTADKPTKSSAGEDYLDNKYEQESFQRQIQFIADQLSEQKAHKYVDNLLDYHEIENKKERKEKEKIFKEKI